MCNTGSSGNGSRWRSHTCCWEALPGKSRRRSRGTMHTSHSSNCRNPASSKTLIEFNPGRPSGRRRRWHNVLVGNALLFGLERRRHAEYGFPVLDCVDPPGAERSTVADAFDQKNRALLGISRPKKIAVQRVHHVPRVDGAHRRHQRLAGYMTTESALQEARFGAEHASSVDVDLKLLKIKDLFDRHAMTVCSSRVLTSRAGRADDRQRSRPR